jgi:hypothetical protein
MTAKPRSRVEKVAEEMYEASRGDDSLTITDWGKLARWHLRELRKAHGRTVGWMLLTKDYKEMKGWDRFKAVAENYRYSDDVLARVVLEPRRGTKGSKR